MAKKYPSIGKSYSCDNVMRVKDTRTLADRSASFMNLYPDQYIDLDVYEVIDSNRSIKIRESGKYLIIARVFDNRFEVQDADGNSLSYENEAIDDSVFHIRKNAVIGTDDIGDEIMKIWIGEVTKEPNGDIRYGIRKQSSNARVATLEEGDTLHFILNNIDGLEPNGSTLAYNSLTIIKLN